MRNTDKYNRFALCREMMETPHVIERLDPRTVEAVQLAADRVLLTGEGSSRIFPAKRVIAQAHRAGWPLFLTTEAATQAMEYDLKDYHVFVASNSGRTAEGVQLVRHLRGGKRAAGASTAVNAAGAAMVTGIVATAGTPIATEADNGIVLQCGPEAAVAATKSVLEQAVTYEVLFRNSLGLAPLNRSDLAHRMKPVLEAELDRSIVDRIAASGTVYFAGRNDGVAEELTLKTNEITRKCSDFLEGTYAVHGIEEVMRAEDVVILIDPYEAQEEKFDQVLRGGVGLEVIAIAPRPTRFPTIPVPEAGDMNSYLLLAAGWNLLVEVGLAAGIDLDTPRRARKVGNEIREA
ncbi:MAG: sugar isomerase [Spirochaetaceae bacterium]|nr:MAG: sugar isomerase [Spirochaetaceae bacterium]